MPGVWVVERLMSDCDYFFEALLEKRLDDFFFVGEAAVGGSDAHAGPVRDVVERDVEAFLSKQLTGRGEQALSIERRVLAECCLGHDLSLTHKWIDRIRLRATVSVSG